MKFRQFLIPAALICVACSRDPEALKRKYLDRGNTYFSKGRYREAGIMYRRAIHTDPRFGLAYYHQALALIKANNLPDTVHALRRAVELLPEGDKRRDARVRLGRILVVVLDISWHRPTSDEVQRLADALLAQDPNSYDGHLLTGQVHLLRAKVNRVQTPREAAEETEKAIVALRQADARKPNQTEVIVPMASALASLSRTKEAIDLLEAHIKRPEAAPQAFSELARRLLHRQSVDQAETVLRSGISRFPDNFEFRVSLLRLLAYQRKTDHFRDMVAAMVREHDRFPAVFEAAEPLYFLLGLGEEVLALCDKAIELRPNQVLRYRVMKVDALARLGRKAEARKLNNEILKRNPDQTEALIREASFALDEGHISTAEKILEHIVVLNPQNALAQYQFGRTLVLTGKIGLARQRFSEAVRLNPGFTDARLELAKLELRVGEYGRAVVSVEEILEQDPSHAEAALVRADALRLLGKLDDAEAAIQSLPAKAPSTLLEVCQLRSAQGRKKEAEDACRDSYLANTADLRGLEFIVNARIDSGESKVALAILENARQSSAGGLPLRMLLADTAIRVKDYQLAITTYEEALDAVGSDPKQQAEILLRLGELQRRSGDLPGALENLRKALKIAPENPFALQNLAVALDLSGDHKSAMPLYQKSLQLFDRNPTVLNNLAYHMAETGGDLDRALTYAQRALQADPGFAEYLDTIGWIYLKKGLVDAALEQFRKLVVKEPNHPGYRYHLGVAHAEKGDLAAARRELQQALQMKPRLEEAAAIRQLLRRLGAS